MYNYIGSYRSTRYLPYHHILLYINNVEIVNSTRDCILNSDIPKIGGHDEY